MTSVLLSESQRRSLEQAAASYEAHLDTAMPYLASRGISEQTARTFRLGYVPQGDEYAGRLAIPYLTADGSVVDIRFRAIGDVSPKYISRPQSKVHLFGVAALLDPGPVVWLTEGEIDCITLTQAGLPACGVPGSNSWQPHWRRLFSDYDRVVAVCDGDAAGRDFGKRVIDQIDGAVMVVLPDGQDVNSVYINEGVDALLGKVGQ